MNTAEHDRLCLAREIVWALDGGVAITLLLAVLHASSVAPAAMDVLLRPLSYLLPERYGKIFSSRAAFVLTDALLYSAALFLAIHLWPRRAAPGSQQLAPPERRRGFRVAATTPVFVYGWRQDEPFAESTETLNISEFGGLIALSTKLAVSQELVLTNLQTETDMPCRVVRSLTLEDGTTLAGVVFPQRTADFWQIEFVAEAPEALEPHSPVAQHS